MTFPYIDAVIAALRPVKETWGEAYVCGGFVRDAILGVTPKDIDVFIFAPGSDRPGWHGPMKSMEHLAQQLDEAGHRTKPINPDFIYPIEEGGTEVVAVLEMEQLVFGLQVQIIMVDGFNAETLLDRFDYGACRAMTDGQYFWQHPDFVADMKDKVFRLRRPREDMCLMSSIERYARFKARPEFAEWKWEPFRPQWCGPEVFDFAPVQSATGYQPREKITDYQISLLSGALA